MSSSTTDSKVAQTFSPVKFLNFQLPLPLPDPMIHHKDSIPKLRIIYKSKGGSSPPPYGVSRNDRVLSKGVLLKRFNQVRRCLSDVVGLSTSECEATLRLLRLWAYYGEVYPKASQVCSEPGCSKATFWRTVAYLQDIALIDVVSRFIIRPHAQISNLYLLKGLIIVIARYLAEHGQAFREKWLEPYLVMPGHLFWGATVSALYPSGEP